MFSPPATMNFTSDRFRLDSMDYKKLTRLHSKTRPVQVSCFSNRITTYSPIILALVLLSTALAIAGSFTQRIRILAGSLVTSVAALVGYAELIGYTASNNCRGTGCITQPTGSETIFGVTRTWGFQQGFYIFTAATILVLVGMVFHQTLTAHRSKGATSNQKA